jgi:chaperonin GroES
LSNMQGGFIGSGVSLRSGSATFRPGEWKKAQAEGGALKDNIVPLPVAGPSSVLFTLLGMMVEAAKDITATKDILTGETQQTNQPVGTTLAMIEQGLKVFTAIYKRIHRSLKDELKKLARLNREFLEPQVYFNFHDEEMAVSLEDYRSDDVDVIPVSDPTIVTDMQRMGQAQFLLAAFRGNPNVDQRELDRRVMEAARVQDIAALMPEPKGPPPPSPDQIKALADAEAKMREMGIKEREAEANVAQKMAGAESQTLQTILTDPMLYPLVREIVRQAEDGQAGVRGMGGPAVNTGGGGDAAPAPIGPVGEVGVGGGDVPEIPGQGPDIGGAVQPQV